MDESFNVTIPCAADMYVIDLSNCGDIVESVISQVDWRSTKLVVFEGGSVERDNVAWMKKYKRRSMRPVFNRLENDFHVITLKRFPSLTVVYKKDFLNKGANV